jgi:hypothetical protein
MAVATDPISSEMRAPWKSWAAMSRPALSVPRGAGVLEWPLQRSPGETQRILRKQPIRRGGHDQHASEQRDADDCGWATTVELEERHWSGSASDSRIEPPIQQIHNEIHCNDEKRTHENYPEKHIEIALDY